MLRTWLVFVGLTLLWIVTRSVYFESWNSGHSPQSFQPSAANDCNVCHRLLEAGEVSIYQKDKPGTRSFKLGANNSTELSDEKIMTLAVRMEACAQICESASSSSKIKRWPQP